MVSCTAVHMLGMQSAAPPALLEAEPPERSRRPSVCGAAQFKRSRGSANQGHKWNGVQYHWHGQAASVAELAGERDLSLRLCRSLQRGVLSLSLPVIRGLPCHQSRESRVERQGTEGLSIAMLEKYKRNQFQRQCVQFITSCVIDRVLCGVPVLLRV